MFLLQAARVNHYLKLREIFAEDLRPLRSLCYNFYDNEALEKENSYENRI